MAREKERLLIMSSFLRARGARRDARDINVAA